MENHLKKKQYFGERTRLMGNIMNNVKYGATDLSGLTEIKFDSGYEIKCSSLDTTVTGRFSGE